MSSRTAERADHGTAARPGDRGIDPWWLAAVPLVALAALIAAMLWTGSGAAPVVAQIAKEAGIEITRAPSAELAGRVRVSHVEAGADYGSCTAEALLPIGTIYDTLDGLHIALQGAGSVASGVAMHAAIALDELAPA